VETLAIRYGEEKADNDYWSVDVVEPMFLQRRPSFRHATQLLTVVGGDEQTR